MIIVKLMGGLANQMFQYAVGRAVALANQTDLKLDIRFYDSQSGGVTKRAYALDVFNISSSIAEPNESDKLCKGFLRLLPIQLYNKLINLFPVHANYRERIFSIYDQNIFKSGKNLYLDGYWQTEKYFASIRETLLKDFALRAEPSAKYREWLGKIEACQAVSLHVRRGDYVTDENTRNFHGGCTLDYYRQAVDIIRGKVADPAFFIFSDDIDWCKANLAIPRQTYYIEGTQDYEELMLMKACRHNIIANSSFSWWGAWLNENPDKFIVAPKLWFADKEANNCDIVPESWIRI